MTAIPFLLIYIPLNLVSRYANAINQGTGRFRAFNVVRLTVQVVYVVGVAALYLAHSISITTVLIVVLAANAAATVVAVGSRASHERRLILNLGLARSLVQYGRRAQLGVLTPVDSLQLDLAALVLLSSSTRRVCMPSACGRDGSPRPRDLYRHGRAEGRQRGAREVRHRGRAHGPGSGRLQPPQRQCSWRSPRRSLFRSYSGRPSHLLLHPSRSSRSARGEAASVRQVAGALLARAGRPSIASYAELGQPRSGDTRFRHPRSAARRIRRALAATGAYVTGSVVCTLHYVAAASA